MDELITRKIFKLDYGMPNVMDSGPHVKFTGFGYIKPYTTDLNAAFDIIDKFNLGLYRFGDYWVLYTLNKYEGVDEEISCHTDPCLAICIAGLRMSGISEDAIEAELNALK